MRIAAGLACLIGCRAPAPAADPAAGGELRTFLFDNPRSLDPAVAADTISIEVAGQIFQGLLQYQPHHPTRGLEIAPAIAARWEVSEGGRLFRFFLRPGVAFHDDPCFPDGRGRDVVASDVTYTLSRFVRESRSGDIGLLLELLAGARDHRDGRATRISGIREEDAHTMTVHLTRSWQGFPFLMLHQPAWVVPREAIAVYGDRFAEHPVGTGPFRLAAWEPASHVLLVRHERY
jgi:peptide/nickel transport system substrate-binding protein